MTILSKSKRGQVESSVWLLIIGMFVLALATVIGHLIWDSFATSASNIDALNTTEAREAIAGFTNAFNMFDTVIAFLVLLAILSVGVTAYALSTPKVYVIVTWIIGLFIGFFSFYLSFLFKEFIFHPALNSISANFPKTIFLLTKLHWIALLMIIIATIVIYSKDDGTSDLGGNNVQEI